MQRPDYEFEQFLEGKHPLSQQYQKESEQIPPMPADLEQKILAEAHKAAKKRIPARRWLSIAASLVLVSLIYRGGDWQFSTDTGAFLPEAELDAPSLQAPADNYTIADSAELLRKRKSVEPAEIQTMVPDTKARLHAQLRPRVMSNTAQFAAADAAVSPQLEKWLETECLLSQFNRYTEKKLALEQWSRHWLQVRHPQLAQLAVARQEQRSWRIQFEHQLINQIAKDAPHKLPSGQPFAVWAQSFDDETLSAACLSNGALCAPLASWQFQLSQPAEVLTEEFNDLYQDTTFVSKSEAIPPRASVCLPAELAVE
ncbi:hypothetical protein ACFSJ3_06430 [Corallincola platygyrae]|uniref:Uncharacterized protein n=1 Tax=Corallincola platygyrae TaxID=1193278 RepID=A0ABW4XKK2_9GAMM